MNFVLKQSRPILKFRKISTFLGWRVEFVLEAHCPLFWKGLHRCASLCSYPPAALRKTTFSALKGPGNAEMPESAEKRLVGCLGEILPCRASRRKVGNNNSRDPNGF